MCVPPSVNGRDCHALNQCSEVVARPETDRPFGVTSPDVFDHLQAALDRDPALQDSAAHLLGKLGEQLRVWRIRRGYTRAQLAHRLAVETDRLLYLEQRLAVLGDIDQEMLRRLLAMLEDRPFDHLLAEIVKEVLAL